MGYNSFFEVGNHVVFTPKNPKVKSELCVVIEKQYRHYKLRFSKHSGVEFWADENQLKLYQPVEKPNYLSGI